MELYIYYLYISWYDNHASNLSLMLEIRVVVNFQEEEGTIAEEGTWGGFIATGKATRCIYFMTTHLSMYSLKKTFLFKFN